MPGVRIFGGWRGDFSWTEFAGKLGDGRGGRAPLGGGLMLDADTAVNLTAPSKLGDQPQ